MRVLLVLPAAEHLRVTHENRDVPERAMLRFSILPLTTVAAVTPLWHKVAICDENVEPLDLDADVDVVGISFMTALANRAYDIADAFRRRGKIVIAGGYHPTFRPEEALEHFDAVVVGEAEGSWPQALADAEAGRLQGIYRRSEPANLRSRPLPRRDLVARTARYYATSNAVQTGRGCTHACRYCSITAFHRGNYRHRPVENVIDELRGLGRDFIFVDDNIIADPEYARQLFRAMVPLKKRWVSQCSIKIADDRELLELAHDAGCKGLFIGIETTSARDLAEMGKGFNDSGRYEQRLWAICRRGIGVIAGIIVGLDSDDATVFRRTFEWLQRVPIHGIQLNILTPLPGTPLHGDFERRGRIVDRDWSHYDFRHCVIRPARMTGPQLQDGADWLYRQYYRLDRIVGRSLKALWQLGPAGAWLVWKLNRTYRYDNIRESVVGRDPAECMDTEPSASQAEAVAF